MQSRHDRRHDSDRSLALLEVVLQERGEAQLSGPYQAPPSWEVQMSFLPFQHERDRATPLPRWSFPEAAASVAFAIVTDNDVGTPTVRRSEDWRGPTTTQRCRPAGGRVTAVVSMTSSFLLVRLHKSGSG